MLRTTIQISIKLKSTSSFFIRLLARPVMATVACATCHGDRCLRDLIKLTVRFFYPSTQDKATADYSLFTVHSSLKYSLLVLLSSVYVKLSKNSFLYASMPKIWPKADAKVLQIFKPRKLFRNFFSEECHFFEFVYKSISFIHYNIYAYERNC